MNQKSIEQPCIPTSEAKVVKFQDHPLTQPSYTTAVIPVVTNVSLSFEEIDLMLNFVPFWVPL